MKSTRWPRLFCHLELPKLLRRSDFPPVPGKCQVLLKRGSLV